MDALLYEERLVNHITHAGIAKHAIVEDGFLAPIDFLSLAVDVDDVAEQRIPMVMLGERASDRPQRARSEAIVGVQYVHDLSCGHRDALVHSVIVALVLLRDPPQVGIL